LVSLHALKRPSLFRPASRRSIFELLESRALLAADLTAANVLVLYNPVSPAGTQIANYYAQVHPGVQLLGINGVDPNSEDTTADAYLSTIRPQVLAALTSSIDVIVTTKGLPLRINVQEAEPPVTGGNPLPTYVDPSGTTRQILDWQPYSSLESELTNIATVSTWQMMGDQSYAIPGQFSANPYFRSTSSFSPAAFGGMVLTSRLDGYAVSDVEGAIDRAQQAFIGPSNSPSGPYWFLVDNDPTKNYAPTMANLVNKVLLPAGLPVVYDDTTAFIGTAPGPVIGYDSHGVHQASTPANYITSGLNITLAAGAVFNSWESYNAYSFTPGGYTGNQGQVAQWLAKGGTAGVGNVQEPGANPSNVANEDQMFAMLLAGKTWAEAAWSSFRQLGYVNTVVGDPLMTWIPLPPVSSVASRLLFYNQSAFDGNTAGVDPLDDSAISDKVAYLPGDPASTNAATAVTHESNYTKGINGLMIDLTTGGTHGAITASDFVFRVGLDDGSGNIVFADATAGQLPTTVSTRAGAGAGGSDRVELIWANNSLRNVWLEVQVLADANTGLAQNPNYPAGIGDIFYFANKVGDTGNDNGGSYITNSSGLSRIRSNPGNGLPVNNAFDVNKDGNVNSTDESAVRDNPGDMAWFSVAVTGPFAPDAGPLAPAAAPAAAPSAASSSISISDIISAAQDSALASGITGLLNNLPSSVPSWLQSRLSNILDSAPAVKIFHTLEQHNSAVDRIILTTIDNLADKFNLHDDVLDGILADMGLE